MRWTVHLDGGPRRVNHAACAVGDFIFSFGGYCTGKKYFSFQYGATAVYGHLLDLNEIFRDCRGTCYNKYILAEGLVSRDIGVRFERQKLVNNFVGSDPN